MDIGMIGLGRMGGAMAERLIRGEHHVVAYDPQEAAVNAAVQIGATGASSLERLVAQPSPPRAA